MNGTKIKYALHCSWREIYRNKLISAFLIVQIAIGTAAFTYSNNLFFSLAKETDLREHAERDISLDIHTITDDYEGESPITQEDVEAIQDICANTAFVYVVIPKFYPYNEDFAEFNLLITDYSQLKLNEGYAYVGDGITQFEEVIRQTIPTGLEIRYMPKAVNEAFTNSEEISTPKSVLIPIKYLNKYYKEIEPAFVHIEWNSGEINDPKTMVSKLENYLNKAHPGFYRYEIGSPNTELASYRTKVDLSIKTIQSGSIIFLLICALGQITAMQILFARRSRTYGIFLCCGSARRVIRLQLMIELGLINLIGATVGCVAGVTAVMNLDLEILPYGISNDIHSEAFIAMAGIVALTVIVNYIVLCLQLRRKGIVTLLRA